MALPVGLGCAPIYPGIIHATPSHFGADRSQAIIGVQMASAYVGNCLMPRLYPLSMMALDAALPCGETACKRRCFNKIRILEEKRGRLHER